MYISEKHKKNNAPGKNISMCNCAYDKKRRFSINQFVRRSVGKSVGVQLVIISCESRAFGQND